MYTISTTMVLNKVLYKNLQYDTDKDFDLISYVPVPGLPLMASTSTGAKTLKEFVEFAQQGKVPMSAPMPPAPSRTCASPKSTRPST